jgi:dTDP-4-dehydrorhamnose reductase
VRVLVTGAGGQVGSEIVAHLESRAARRVRGEPWVVLGTTHGELDVSSRDVTLAEIVRAEPDLIIHAAAWTDVDGCEIDLAKAYAVNALGTRHVAEAARLLGAHVCYISTDYVFDGTADRPYTEWDRPNPLSGYGRSKLGGELELDRSATIVRTSWVFGRTGKNFVKTVLRLATGQDQLRFVDDQRGSPTYAGDLAAKVVDLAVARRPGIYHVTNQGDTTWHGLAAAIVRLAGEDPRRVRPISTSELQPARPAPRPAFSVLDNAALRLDGDELLRPWESALQDLVGELAGG